MSFWIGLALICILAGAVIAYLWSRINPSERDMLDGIQMIDPNDRNSGR